MSTTASGSSLGAVKGSSVRRCLGRPAMPTVCACSGTHAPLVLAGAPAGAGGVRRVRWGVVAPGGPGGGRRPRGGEAASGAGTRQHAEGPWACVRACTRTRARTVHIHVRVLCALATATRPARGSSRCPWQGRLACGQQPAPHGAHIHVLRGAHEGAAHGQARTGVEWLPCARVAAIRQGAGAQARMQAGGHGRRLGKQPLWRLPPCRSGLLAPCTAAGPRPPTCDSGSSPTTSGLLLARRRWSSSSCRLAFLRSARGGALMCRVLCAARARHECAPDCACACCGRAHLCCLVANMRSCLPPATPPDALGAVRLGPAAAWPAPSRALRCFSRAFSPLLPWDLCAWAARARAASERRAGGTAWRRRLRAVRRSQHAAACMPSTHTPCSSAHGRWARPFGRARWAAASRRERRHPPLPGPLLALRCSGCVVVRSGFFGLRWLCNRSRQNHSNTKL